MGDAVKVQKLDESMIITVPIEICEWLELKEGSQLEIEPFTCGGENGARMKLKK